jgi:hypothetical protein
LINARPDLLNAIDKRPDPLDLIVFNVVNGTRGKTSYLLVQSESMVIEQQRLPGEYVLA